MAPHEGREPRDLRPDPRGISTYSRVSSKHRPVFRRWQETSDIEGRVRLEEAGPVAPQPPATPTEGRKLRTGRNSFMRSAWRTAGVAPSMTE